MRPFTKLLVILGIFAGTAVGQEVLTLPRAVAIALEKSPAHQLAVADAAEAGAGVELARAAFVPRIEFSESATVGNDPVYAFGTRLRQGRFSAADFQLNRLNYPDAIGNFSTNIGGRWNLFDSSAKRFELRRAKSLSNASKLQLSRADQELIYRVIRAYFGTLLAERQRIVSEQALQTAEALVESASARVKAGTVVESDLLAAQVVLANRRQELIRSRGNAEIARTELETVLGMKLGAGDRLAEIPEARTFASSSLEETEARAMKQRADLLSAGSQLDAQQSAVKAARAAFGPRLDVFGSWQADNVNVTSNGSSNWTAGLGLRIDLFDREKNSKLSLEKAALARAKASQAMAIDSVRVDVRRAYVEQDAARQMVDVARGAVTQADEALRIVRDRYDSGLLQITELLRAGDAARAAHIGYWQAVYGQAITYAALQLASGDLNPQSSVVTQ